MSSPDGAPAAVGVEDALETLVRQFSDPLACLRELVQNSLDAGSRQIDVDFHYAEPVPPAIEGLMTLEVQDQGEGMDRQIIETRLTRLFASSKDGDFTKIGRFGIGFVSVFALEPDAVCVDTGRGGERWRVLFRRDRSFTRIALDEPVAGTRIRLLKTVAPAVFAALRDRARDVLAYWCKHVDGDIYLDGALVSGPLALACPCQARHQEEGTDVIVGFPEDFQTFAGYYNKGLTLFEGEVGGLPGLAFKVSSRYLEHTLTRDNVLHDDHYQKAMDIVHRLAAGPLHEALWARLLAGGTPADWHTLADRLQRPLDTGRRAVGGRLPEAFHDRPILPAEAGPLSLKDLRRQAERGRLYHAPTSDALTQARRTAGDRILLVGEGPRATALLAAAEVAADAKIPSLHAHFVLPRPVSADAAQAARPLQSALVALLKSQGTPPADVAVAHLPTRTELALGLARLDVPTALTPPDPEAGGRAVGVEPIDGRLTLVLNADHPMVGALQPLALREPELAAFLLARLLALSHHRLTQLRDTDLAAAAVAARRARLAPAGGRS